VWSTYYSSAMVQQQQPRLIVVIQSPPAVKITTLLLCTHIPSSLVPLGIFASNWMYQWIMSSSHLTRLSALGINILFTTRDQYFHIWGNGKIEMTAGSSETLATTYKTTRYHNPEYRNLNFHSHGNLKSHIETIFFLRPCIT
jgi:hypothetical protein